MGQTKTDIEDMYLLSDEVIKNQKLEELKQDLQDAGYDLSEFTSKELRNMVEAGV